MNRERLAELNAPGMREKRVTERAAIVRREDAIIGKTKDMLVGTALVDSSKEWKQNDVDAVREMLISVAPFADPKIRPAFWRSTLLASIYQRKIAEKAQIDDLQPKEAESIGLIHDVGKLISPRYFVAELVQDKWAADTGIRRDIMEKIHDVPGVLGVNAEPIFDLEETSVSQRIHDVADNLGKLNADGTLFDVNQLEEYATGQSKRYGGNALWPSEQQALLALTEDGKQSLSIHLTLAEIAFLQRTYGIDFYQLREEVMEEYQQPENQEWLARAMDAQESLDPLIDEKLERPSVKTVVLDIGGVLLGSRDTEISTSIADSLDVPEEKVLEALWSLDPDGKAGQISHDDYLAAFYNHVNVPLPEDAAQARIPFVQPDIYTPIEGMPSIIDRLRRSDVAVYLLSDLIAPVGETVREKVAELYPGIDQDKILFSYELGASKLDGSAFPALLDRLDNPDPASVLFIDDREEFTNAASGTHGLRRFHFREGRDNSDHRTGIDRLEDELELAEII
jgi:FMN phosphatase YigB (HAD superfamily)